ncbi:MAG: hypothetical protein JW928_09615 [Candidatus Aureabacteria bacterium]|nr:hypothetical protein [Candidatus Auribacterota bacterium]
MSFIEQKSSLMYKIMLGAGLVLFIYFNPRLFAMLIGEESLLAKFILVVFILLLNLFWFFRLYYLVIMIFSTKRLKGIEIKKEDFQEPPPVAIFYVTKNDFQERAVMSCIRQDYDDFHVFILDDADYFGQNIDSRGNDPIYREQFKFEKLLK